MEKNNHFALPTSLIAKQSKLNYDSCKEYLQLISLAQEMPHIERIQTPNGELFRMQGLLSLSNEERKKVLVNEFGISKSSSDELYLELFEKNITSEQSAIKLQKNQIIEQGLKLRHLIETPDKRIFLSKIGIGIAKGAKKLFIWFFILKAYFFVFSLNPSAA